MLLEFAAARVMAPWFGTSIFVWGNIIGVILIALSAVYYLGGRIADKNPNPERLFDIVWGAGLFSSIIPAFVFLITTRMGTLSISGVSTLVQSVVGSFVVVLLLFALPIMLLGMVSPFVIRLATTSVEEAGKVAGGLYAASTLGSIVGTFASSFVVVPLLGSRETILLSASILIVASAWVSEIKWKRLAVLAIPAIMYVLFTGAVMRANAAVLHEEETLYQFVQIYETEEQLKLVYNEGIGTQSIYQKDGLLTGAYFDYMNLMPVLGNFPEDAHIGVLGLAGGTATRQLRHYYPEFELTGVEIDPRIVDLANEYFELGEQDVNVVVDDARIYMRRTDETFDMVLIDAYSSEIYIPWHMTTLEFFEDVKSHLKPGGIVAFNIGSTHGDSELLDSITTTLDQTFAEVYVYPVPNSFNNVVFATDSTIDKEALLDVEGELTPLAVSMYRSLRNPQEFSGTVLTDNRAPIELYTETMIANYILDNL